MPQFNDRDNLPPRKLIPAGDNIFCVREFSISIQAGGKTAGSDKYEMELEIEGKDTCVLENLIDHAKCAWKIDCFLKSAGVKIAKGQVFEFREDTAEARGVPWVNPIGLRGHCHVTVEEYEKNGEKKKVNKIDIFYTDKPKLPANEILRAAAAQAEEDIPFN